MAMRATEQQLREAVQPHLEPGESVRHIAYGIKPPMVLVAVIPILYTMFTSHYVFALTDRRLIVMQISANMGLSFKVNAKQVTSYPLGPGLGQVTNKSGPIFTYVGFASPNGSLKVKFHRMGLGEGNNREQAEGIGNALQQASRAPSA
jgi:hypothetical protein